MSTVDLPILKIKQEDGDQALLRYDLTDVEQTLFKEMDDATSKLPESSPLDQYHDVVATAGSKHGLSRRQSIAFWTRATFSMFEQ